MAIAVYAGSFDPITNGHIEILKNASEIFEKVIVLVAYNPDKKSFIPVADRVDLIKKSVQEFKNVEVDSYNGFTCDYAKSKGATVLLRGLRNSLDFEYEAQLANVNNSLEPSLKTVCLFSKPEHNFISSSMVKEIYLNKGDISKYVPSVVFEYLKK